MCLMCQLNKPALFRNHWHLRRWRRTDLGHNVNTLTGKAERIDEAKTRQIRQTLSKLHRHTYGQTEIARKIYTADLLKGSAGNLLRAEEGADTIWKTMRQAGLETKRIIHAKNNLTQSIGEWSLRVNKDIEPYMKEATITKMFTIAIKVNQLGQGNNTTALRILAKSLQSQQEESDNDTNTNEPNDTESQRQK